MYLNSQLRNYSCNVTFTPTQCLSIIWVILLFFMAFPQAWPPLINYLVNYSYVWNDGLLSALGQHSPPLGSMRFKAIGKWSPHARTSQCLAAHLTPTVIYNINSKRRGEREDQTAVITGIVSRLWPDNQPVYSGPWCIKIPIPSKITRPPLVHAYFPYRHQVTFSNEMAALVVNSSTASISSILQYSW